MTYVSWAAFHEGGTDALYFEVLLPRLMEEIVLRDGVRNSDIPLAPAIKLGNYGRAIEEVAIEICAAKDAFQLVFIHADLGGRALAESVDARSHSYCMRAREICDWRTDRCVVIKPKRETESWILADPQAVAGALGFNGNTHDVGLPPDARAAERLADPKATLETALKLIRGGRRRPARIEELLPAIAQRQSFEALRRSESFCDFEMRLRKGLADVGCIARED